jgi:hypothetical protein
MSAAWQASVDAHDGLPALTKGGAAALSSSFAFWGNNWSWADLETQFKVTGPFEYSITGKNAALDFDLAARISKASDRQGVWAIDLDARSASPGVIGGGISFKFDLAQFGSELGEPQLLPDSRGWTWGHEGGARIEMRFDPAMAAVYFESGRKSEVRAFFYKGEVPRGHAHYTATLSVSGDIALEAAAAEKFGAADYTAWPAGILDDGAAVDLSFLNAAEIPAGKHGFVKAQGEDHADELVFGDGTPARFWGANLTGYALFGTPKENVKLQAHRLSALGFNLVRIHHHDSEWVDPNIFGPRSVTGTKSLDAAMLEKLDWWIKCLKDEGIYVWLDLHVGRQVKAADGIEGFDEISRGKPSASLLGYSYVNASIRAAMKRFDESYLGHANPYTELLYKDDPAIVAVLITNENDLTQHFGNALLPDKGVPIHSALYMREADSFAARYSLPRDKVWRSWEDGPSKLFLNDLERRFDVDMIAHLRALGVKSPIVPTSTWGGNPLSSLPALTAGDIIDVHSYGGSGELGKNPIFAANLMDWIAAAHVVGKPLTVTEWGLDEHGALAADRQDLPLYVAASASMQGLSALLFFAYAQEPLIPGRGTVSVYQAYDDPALVASFPAAALLYRQGHVAAAATSYVFAPTPEMLFDHALSAGNSVALRTAAERGKLLIAMPAVRELPWLIKGVVPANAKLIRDVQQSFIPRQASSMISDNGELDRSWDEGTFTINTPRTQSAMGWIGGKTFTLADVELAMSTENAVVAVQSLDGKPIAQSRKILISLAARSIPQDGNSLPFYSEPLRGKIVIRAQPNLHLRIGDSRSGHAQVMSSYANGRYALTLKGPMRSSWLLLDSQSSTVHASGATSRPPAH